MLNDRTEAIEGIKEMRLQEKVDYLEKELARYKQALEDSIKREKIARKVIEDKNKKYMK